MWKLHLNFCKSSGSISFQNQHSSSGYGWDWQHFPTGTTGTLVASKKFPLSFQCSGHHNQNFIQLGGTEGGQQRHIKPKLSVWQDTARCMWENMNFLYFWWTDPLKYLYLWIKWPTHLTGISCNHSISCNSASHYEMKPKWPKYSLEIKRFFSSYLFLQFCLILLIFWSCSSIIFIFSFSLSLFEHIFSFSFCRIKNLLLSHLCLPLFSPSASVSLCLSE